MGGSARAHALTNVVGPLCDATAERCHTCLTMATERARSYHDFVIPQGYVPPPYETSDAAPSVICLGRGRQLFVDDFFVDTAASNVERAWHTATIHSMHALVPSLPWETGGGQRRTARPFGAGSLIDPTGSKLLLWYRCGCGEGVKGALALHSRATGCASSSRSSGCTEIAIWTASIGARRISSSRRSTSRRSRWCEIFCRSPHDSWACGWSS